MKRITPGKFNKRAHASLLAACLAAVILLVTYQPASAHTEGKMQLSAEPAGPFKMTVFSSPDPAITGDIHIAALIFVAEDARPVLDADVLVTVEPVDGEGPSQKSQAVQGDSENKLLFEAIIDVSAPGLYEVSIAVEDADGQSGQASFELEVTSDEGFNWLYIIPVIIFVLIVVVLIVFRKSRRGTSHV
jgi:hypothetical protein